MMRETSKLWRIKGEKTRPSPKFKMEQKQTCSRRSLAWLPRDQTKTIAIEKLTSSRGEMPSVLDDGSICQRSVKKQALWKQKPFLQYPEDSAPLGMLLYVVDIQHCPGTLIYLDRVEGGTKK